MLKIIIKKYFHEEIKLRKKTVSFKFRKHKVHNKKKPNNDVSFVNNVIHEKQ